MQSLSQKMVTLGNDGHLTGRQTGSMLGELCWHELASTERGGVSGCVQVQQKELLRSIPRACHWQQEQTIRCTCAIICCSNCKDSNIGWQIQLRDFQEPFHPWEYYFVCVYQHYHSPQSRKLHTFLITVLLSDNARNSKAILLIWGFFFNDKELTFQFIIAKEEEVRFVCQKYRNC